MDEDCKWPTSLIVGCAFDGCVTVTVAGRPMLYEVAIRGMDVDLFEEARKLARTAQAVVNAYSTLHFLRHQEEWHGFAAW